MEKHCPWQSPCPHDSCSNQSEVLKSNVWSCSFKYLQTSWVTTIASQSHFEDNHWETWHCHHSNITHSVLWWYLLMRLHLTTTDITSNFIREIKAIDFLLAVNCLAGEYCSEKYSHDLADELHDFYNVCAHRKNWRSFWGSHLRFWLHLKRKQQRLKKTGQFSIAPSWLGGAPNGSQMWARLITEQ